MDKAEYVLLFVGVLVLAFTVFSFFSAPKVESAPLALGAQGQVLQTAGNDRIFQQLASQAGSECGSLTDAANVQHLSHHPERYADCLKKVDPAFLKQASGQTLQQLLG